MTQTQFTISKIIKKLIFVPQGVLSALPTRGRLLVETRKQRGFEFKLITNFSHLTSLVYLTVTFVHLKLIQKWIKIYLKFIVLDSYPSKQNTKPYTIWPTKITG